MRCFSASAATLVGVCAILAAFSVGSCKTNPDPSKSTSPSLSANTEVRGPAVVRSVTPQPTVTSAPIPKSQVEAAVNPTKLPPYDGPTGIVEGTVRMAGDPPPEVELRLPVKCMGAGGTYGRLYRQGDDREAADVLVAVTGYKGYVPEKEEAVPVTIEDCAYSARTFALTYGQRLEVRNEDEHNSFIPILHGSRYTAFMVAVPKGDPVKLYPHRVGQYELADNMNRPWMSADVFVLKYATHDVTGLDGRFRIEGIPVGEVRIDALHPGIDVTEGKNVKVKEGEVTEVDFVLSFDAEKYHGKTQSHPIAPAPSSSVPKVPPVK